MSFRVPLPSGGHLSTLDVLDPSSSGIQRHLRRSGVSSYEPSTAATLLTLFDSTAPGFVFYDVGANIGFYSAIAAAVFQPSSVVAFEPTPEIASIAEGIARANHLGVAVERCALSDECGFADLHLSDVGDTSNSLNARFRQGSRTVRVPVRTVDDLVESGDRPAPDIMKIDVETHEAAVLRGASGTIEAHRPWLVVEVLTSRHARDFAAEITDALAGLDYSFYELSDRPTFAAARTLRASGGGSRDWLLAPTPLDEDFPARHGEWARRWADCTPERNSRAPIGPAVRRAWQRGGAAEIIATGRREAARRVRRWR